MHRVENVMNGDSRFTRFSVKMVRSHCHPWTMNEYMNFRLARRNCHFEALLVVVETWDKHFWNQQKIVCAILAHSVAPLIYEKNLNTEKTFKNTKKSIRID